MRDNLRFGYEHDFIDEIAHDWKREWPERRAKAIGDRRRFHRRLNGAFALRERGITRKFGLRADDFDRRLQRFCGDGDPRDESAATERNDDRIKLRTLVEEFKCDRSLSCDHVGMVVRRNHRCASFGDDARSGRLASFERWLAFDDPASIAAHGGLLHFRGIRRHHDVRGNSAHPRSERKCLRMVPRRVRDDAAGRCRVIEHAYGIGRAAKLKGTRLLEEFAFEPKSTIGDRVERGVRHDRRAMRETFDAMTRRADGGEIGGIGRCGGSSHAVSLPAWPPFHRPQFASIAELRRGSMRCAKHWRATIFMQSFRQTRWRSGNVLTMRERASVARTDWSWWKR